MSNIPILIFEGMDGTGKTTLIKEIAKRTDYKYICIDRAMVGFKTYRDIYGKPHLNEEYDQLEKSFYNIPHLMIYCRPAATVIQKRLKERNEILRDEVDIKEVLKIYDGYFFISDLNKIMIDTCLSVDECVKMIFKRLEEVQPANTRLTSSLVLKGRETHIITYEPIYLELLDECFNDVVFDYKVDRPYYDMLEFNLAHLLHKLELGLINKRQLVYTSTDCISMIQMDVSRPDKIICHVHQRSLNMAHHAHNDICAIHDMVKRINNLKPVDINYTVAFPHYIDRG